MTRLTATLTRLTATLTAAAVLVGVLGISAAQPVEAANTACNNGWREMPTPPSVFLSTAFDVVTRGGKEAWIVGGTNTGVLALRWTSAGWKQTAKGTAGHRGLVGATAIGPDRVLGVGYDRPHVGNGSGSLRPISGRVIGSTWRGRAVPSLPGPRATLTDVVAMPGGRAIAVGTRLQSGNLRATALNWNGKKWVPSEPWKGSGSGLLGINRASSGAIWAVGWRESRPGRPRPYIVRRAGNGWKSVKPAPLQAGNAALTDVHFRSGNDGYAVGYLAVNGTDKHHVVLMHWDGSNWRNVALPWAADFPAMPRAVSVGKDGTVYIAGTKTTNATREPRGFIAHGKNGIWRVSSLGTPDDVRSEVMAVAATDQGAVAAATVGASLLVLKTCGENVPSAISTAGRKKGTTKRKLGVSRIAARRASQRRDAGAVHEHHDPDRGIAGPAEPSGARAFSLSGDSTEAYSLASSPVKHPAFKVGDVSARTGLGLRTKTYDGFAADFDGNGYKDVFFSRHGTVLPRLAMNQGGSFANAPVQAFSSVDRHGCDQGDIDGDGNKDILCAVGGSRGKAIRRHELSLKPDRAGGSVARDTLGISDPLGRGRFASVLKLDGDKFPEVFIANAPDRDDGWPGYNRFYRNVNGTLLPAPEVGLDSSHGAECVETGDFDQDGDEDLAYCTQYPFRNRTPGLRFMRNDNGVLHDRTAALKIRQMGDIDVAFADVTGDGRKDLIQLAPNRLRVSRWTRKGYGRIFEIKVTDAWALAAGDASGDGRADIYIVRGNDKRNKPDRLLVSKNAGTKFISVRIPVTSAGSADDVIALDYDKNGLMDFVVLNGRTKPGPVQLLASFPR